MKKDRGEVLHVRVRCLEDNLYPAGPSTLTVGKVYEARGTAEGIYWLITNDFGIPNCSMDKSRFEVVEVINGSEDRTGAGTGAGTGIKTTVTFRLLSEMGPECDILIGPWEEDPESDTVSLSYEEKAAGQLLMDLSDIPHFIATLQKYVETVEALEALDD